jgi:hypothetical protein
MFRQARHQRIYWFCPSCYQEMPNLMEILTSQKREQMKLVSPKILLEVTSGRSRV